ncbi:MAG: MFS transporter [Chitinivibrionales bacterium]|nr:MFS transporter [Chitinivibrionales bacterium]
MKKRQTTALFITSLVPFVVGNGLLPHLPVYARTFGASSFASGYYVAIAFTATAIGSIIAGKLSDLLDRRKVLLWFSTGCMVPLIYLMGMATSFSQLAVLTGLVWFFGGAAISLVAILVGLSADTPKRGRSFGIVGITVPAGTLIGGIVIGPIIDHSGYGTMFLVLSCFSLLSPIAILLLHDKSTNRSETHVAVQHSDKRVRRLFILVLFAQLIAMIANGSGHLGRSLSMDMLEYSSTSISTTAIAAGLIALPIPFLLGYLSDKFGRKKVLLSAYLSGALSLILFAVSVRIWHFWIGASFLAVLGVSLSIGPALMTDIFPKKNIGSAISLFQGFSWIGSIVGSAGFGYVFQRCGLQNGFLIGTVFPIASASILLLTFNPQKTRYRNSL